MFLMEITFFKSVFEYMFLIVYLSPIYNDPSPKQRFNTRYRPPRITLDKSGGIYLGWMPNLCVISTT